MKKILVLFIAVLICHSLISQTPDVKWGPIIKEHKKIAVSNIIGSDEDGTYFLKSKRTLFKTTYFIDKLDRNLSRTVSKELPLEREGKTIQFNEVLFRNNKIEFFTSEIDKEKHTNTFFLQTIDKRTLALSDKRIKLMETNYGDAENWYSASFVVKKSRDESKLIVRYNPPNKHGAQEKFTLASFDENHTKLWQKEVALPYKDSETLVVSSLIDNWGNYHFLIKHRDFIKENRDLSFRWKFEILSITENGKRTKKYPVHLKNHYVSQLQITVNKDKKILCAGFYSDESSSTITGTFFMRINPDTKKIEQENYKAFDFDFITQAMTIKQKEKTKKKQAKGKNIELYEYVLDELIIKGDGGVILIGEQYISYTTTSQHVDANGNWTTTTTTHYYYNDIIVVNITPTGTIDWAKKIPKRQHSTNDGGYASSYYLTVTSDKLHFIFNDHIKNILEPEEGKYRQFTSGKYGAVAIASVDNKGNVDRNLLFKSKDISCLVRPKYCHQSDKNTTVLYGTIGRFKQFGKLKF